MKTQNSRARVGEGVISDLWDAIRRAFAEFLAIPTCLIISFLLLATGSYALDRTEVLWLEPVRQALRAHVFADAGATSALLSTIASSLITATSITISLLLIAVQQSAGSMTSEVFEQFLRRRQNQFYFGFFVGLALYALVTLATVNEPFNPVFGATLALLLTIIALYLLLLLFYTTINQMRPVEIIETIHDHILAARERQLLFLRKTRRASRYTGAAHASVQATKHGFVTRVNVDAIGAAIKNMRGEVEVVLLVSMGSYVAFQDVIADIKARTDAEAVQVGSVVQRAVHLERQRDITVDPAYGIEQLETIAWTSISTAKSNPAPGLRTLHGLRDVLARWSMQEEETRDEDPLPIIYSDNVFAKLLDAFESLAVVSSESMQHQNFTEVVRTLAVTFDRLPVEQQTRAEDLILRIISALGEHVLTAELNAALSALINTLDTSARFETAAAVRAAQEALGLSVGKLNSRSTRVPNKG